MIKSIHSSFIISLVLHLAVGVIFLFSSKRKDLKEYPLTVEIVTTVKQVTQSGIKTLEKPLNITPKTVKGNIIKEEKNAKIGESDIKRSQEGLVQEESLDESPKLKALPNPEYPKNLAKLGIEGSVKLKLLVNKEGVVESSEVLSFDHEEFKQAALKEARNLHFIPLKKNNLLVSAWIKWDIIFEL